MSENNSSTSCQSLLDACKNKHWSLLQLFAQTEVMLAEHLENAPRTFGAKLGRLKESEISPPSRMKLTDARNLLAHSNITVHQRGNKCYSIWRISDAKGGLNSREFTKDELEAWSREIKDELMGLIKKMMYCEPPNSSDLIFGFNVDPPKHRAKLLAHRSRIEARANERDYSIIFE